MAISGTTVGSFTTVPDGAWLRGRRSGRWGLASAGEYRYPSGSRGDLPNRRAIFFRFEAFSVMLMLEAGSRHRQRTVGLQQGFCVQ